MIPQLTRFFILSLAVAVLGACGGAQSGEIPVEGSTLVIPSAHTAFTSSGAWTDGEHTEVVVLGDEIHKPAPDGVGSELFVTFDLETLPAVGGIERVELRTPHEVELIGAPFRDLGPLVIETVAIDVGGDTRFEVSPGGEELCTLAQIPDGRFYCEVTSAIAEARQFDRESVQFRIHFESVHDWDDRPDRIKLEADASAGDELALFELHVHLVP